ncbi:MAG: radical SAM protein [Proteobacteria bacterium]|nr:radical SAM protein [Pseudomonadota bacterium]
MADTETYTYQSPTYREIHRGRAVDWRDRRGPRYADYRRQWDRTAADRLAPAYPLHVDIETTNACNLQCPMCPRTHLVKAGNKRWSPGGKIGLMDFDLYRSLIDQAAEQGAFSVKLNFLGEPLIHPQVVDQVAYAAGRGLWVMMNTNAVALTQTMSRRLLEAGVSDVFFSFDSPDAEVYERIRVGAKFDRVVRNIQRFMELKYETGRLDVQTRVSMISYWDDKGAGENEREAYLALFDELGVDEIGFAVYTDPNLDYSTLLPEPMADFCCDDLFRRVFVLWDGAVQVCCGEWERQLQVGDARRNSLAEIWRGPVYDILRRAHAEGNYHRIEVCRRCSVPYLIARDRAEAQRGRA